MIMYWVMLPLAVLAGMGLMKLIDRQWPQRIEVSHQPGPPETGRVVAFDDTMDVLASGVEAGRKIAAGRHARPTPSLAELAHEWEPFGTPAGNGEPVMPAGPMTSSYAEDSANWRHASEVLAAVDDDSDESPFGHPYPQHPAGGGR